MLFKSKKNRSVCYIIGGILRELDSGLKQGGNETGGQKRTGGTNHGGAVD